METQEKAIIMDGTEYSPVPGMPGFYVSAALEVARRDRKGRLRKGSTTMRYGKLYAYCYMPGTKRVNKRLVAAMRYAAQEGIPVQNLKSLHYKVLPGGRVEAFSMDGVLREAAKKALSARREKARQSPEKALSDLREWTNGYAAWVEHGDPLPIINIVRRAANDAVAPTLMSEFCLCRETADDEVAEAASITLERIAAGLLLIKPEKYMLKIARRNIRLHRKLLRLEDAKREAADWDGCNSIYDFE